MLPPAGGGAPWQPLGTDRVQGAEPVVPPLQRQAPLRHGRRRAVPRMKKASLPVLVLKAAACPQDGCNPFPNP